MNRAMTGFLRSAWAAVVPAFLVSCAAAPAPPAGAPPEALARATQLLVVTTPNWDASAGELRRFVRDAVNAPWLPAGGAVPVVVGRAGLGWGVGFDSLAAAGTEPAGPRKREGDGRSPAGAYSLGQAFGFAPADSMSTIRLPYVPLASTTECVDDTSSAHYNRVLDRGSVADVDWRSAERMREISLYRLGVLVDYNAAPPVSGRGSCIFVHIWDGPASTTSGCTALDAAELTELVEWLEPEARPALVQLPAATYTILQRDWGLPTLDG